MLKGFSSAIWLSIALHLLILLVVNQTDFYIASPQQLTPKAITGYLYQPAVEEKVTNTQERTIEKERAPVEPTIKQQQEIKKTLTQEQTTKNIKNDNVNNENIAVKDTAPLTSSLEQTRSTAPAISSKAFSAIDAFNKHKDQQMFDELLQQHNQFAKGSVFNPSPNPVPHSQSQVSEEEKRKAATQRLGGGISMIKGEDGNCFVERDLTAVGIEGVTSREGFSCGQSDFDKAFKAHMKKLKKKVGK